MRAIPQEILYRLRDVVSITGRRPSTLYKDISEGRFPRAVQLGPQSVAWKKSDLDAWIASRPITTSRETSR